VCLPTRDKPISYNLNVSQKILHMVNKAKQNLNLKVTMLQQRIERAVQQGELEDPTGQWLES